MIRIFGVSVVSAVIYALIKKYSPEYALLTELAVIVAVLLSAYPYLKDVVDFFYDSSDYSDINKDYIHIIIKTIGVAVVSQLSSDICRDSGQTALAGKVELAAKLIMAVLAIPLAKTLIEVAVKMIGAV